jgi:pimeloyl-ACP methyl ester carboxylesterase
MIYLAFLIFTLCVLLFAFYQWQYFMVFSPVSYKEGEFVQGCELLSITTPDGVELEGVVYEPSDPHATLLFFGGRSHDSVGLINRLAQSYDGVRIVTFNYRSYGESGGEVSEKNLLNDGVYIAKLVQKHYGEFAILGFSLGSSVASFVASQHATQALFLVGGFDSICLLAKQRYHIGWCWLYRYKFNTQEFVKKVEAKTLLFVSKDDEITFIDNARNLKKSIANLVWYEEFEGLSHKELLWDTRVVTKINKVLLDEL